MPRVPRVCLEFGTHGTLNRLDISFRLLACVRAARYRGLQAIEQVRVRIRRVDNDNRRLWQIGGLPADGCGRVVHVKNQPGNSQRRIRLDVAATQRFDFRLKIITALEIVRAAGTMRQAILKQLLNIHRGFAPRRCVTSICPCYVMSSMCTAAQSFLKQARWCPRRRPGLLHR